MERFETGLDWNIRRVNEWLAKSNDLWKALDGSAFMSGEAFEQWRQEVIGAWSTARVLLEGVIYELAHARAELERKDLEISHIHRELAACGLYLTHDGLRYMNGDGRVDPLDINNAALFAEDRDTMTDKEA
jgi:hypothetical protein